MRDIKRARARRDVTVGPRPLARGLVWVSRGHSPGALHSTKMEASWRPGLSGLLCSPGLGSCRFLQEEPGRRRWRQPRPSVGSVGGGGKVPSSLEASCHIRTYVGPPPKDTLVQGVKMTSRPTATFFFGIAPVFLGESLAERIGNPAGWPVPTSEAGLEDLSCGRDLTLCTLPACLDQRRRNHSLQPLRSCPPTPPPHLLSHRPVFFPLENLSLQ